jgi:nitrite reductase/ring-hydroxylating ferredoxin subunit
MAGRTSPSPSPERDELKVDQMKLLRVGPKRIVLARTEKGYVAFDDRCTHRGGSLAGGVMICGTVQCLWHGSQFDVSTGKVKAGPAKQEIGVYPVKEEGEEVRLIL